MRKKISIINYGIGNYASLQGMLSRLNCLSNVTNDINEIKNSDLIILPGVGTFKTAMKKLKKDKIDRLLFSLAKKKKINFRDMFRYAITHFFINRRWI